MSPASRNTTRPSGPRVLVIVACGAAKADGPRPAAQLYTGAYFTSCLRAARALAGDDSIRILSARHGLIALDEHLAPYEHQLPRTAGERDRLAALVREQARTGGLSEHRVVVLGGRAYTDIVRQAGWTQLTAPLSGLAGIGHQRRRLAEITRRRRL